MNFEVLNIYSPPTTVSVVVVCFLVKVICKTISYNEKHLKSVVTLFLQSYRNT